MPKNPPTSRKKIFFNASVIIAGLHSPTGGSAILLRWAREKKIKGVISEIVLDEALRHADKIPLTTDLLEKAILSIFQHIIPAPNPNTVSKYIAVSLDVGDTHLFASSEDNQADYLVSLDKKHVLSLKGKITRFHIVSPGELITATSPHRRPV